jgi:hypothetical protein
MAEEPGWELLRKEVGGDTIAFNTVNNEFELTRTDNPYFALYHPASGRLRVFFYLEPSAVVDLVTIAVRHDAEGFRAGPDNARTGILEWWNEPAHALDTHQAYDGYFFQENVLLPDAYTWAMLEFKAAYDPCVCMATSYLMLDVDNWAFNYDPATGEVASFFRDNRTEVLLFVPNSRFDPPIPAFEPFLSHYPQPLGVFNLLSPPVLEVSRSKGPNPYVKGFRFAQPLEYVVNPYAGLGEPVAVAAALHWEQCYQDDFGSYATPRLGLSCLSDYLFVVNEGSGYEGEGLASPDCTGEPLVELQLTFASGAVQRQRFKAQFKDVSYRFEDTPYTIVTAADQEVASCAPLAAVQGEALIDYCTRRYDPFPHDNRPNPPVAPPRPSVAAEELWVYPNPFVDAFTILLPRDAVGQRYSFALYNSLGQRVWQRQDHPVTDAAVSFYGEFTPFPAGGVYYLSVRQGDWSATTVVYKQ